MNVSLTPELERYVQEKVQTGRYNSASEVVREALRSLHEREELHQVQIQGLRKRTGEKPQRHTPKEITR